MTAIFHLPPQQEAWHLSWLTRVVQKILVVSDKTGKRQYLKGITFFPEIFHRDEPFHLNSPWNYRVFHTNGKRSKTLSALPWSGYLSACLSFFVTSCNASISGVTTEKSRENTSLFNSQDNTHYGKNFAAKTLYSASLSF